MQRIVLLALALGLLSAPAAHAKKPPSFALWYEGWNVQHDPIIDSLATGCVYLFGQSDDKLGACFAKREGRLLHARQPEWERQVARIARGQTVRCKMAIHRYRLAARKSVNATLVYLDSHQHTAMTKINDHLAGNPYATLKSLSDAAKSRAIRICG